MVDHTVLTEKKFRINNNDIVVAFYLIWFNSIFHPKNSISADVQGISIFDCILVGLNLTLYSGMPFLMISRNLEKLLYL